MEGWCSDYVRASYRRWFVEGSEVGTEPNLSQSLREIGVDPVKAVQAASERRVSDSYDNNTREARRLGVFGAPTFGVSGELFWGDDRLEDAIDWHTKGKLCPV